MLTEPTMDEEIERIAIGRGGIPNRSLQNHYPAHPMVRFRGFLEPRMDITMIMQNASLGA
jgi:hypothetical protein